MCPELWAIARQVCGRGDRRRCGLFAPHPPSSSPQRDAGRHASGRHRLLLALALAWTISACRGPTPTATPPPAATPSPTHTATITTTPTPSVTPTPTFPADAIVSVDALNLRAGPDTGHPIVAGVGAATPVAIRGRNDDGSWLAVRLPSEQEGWLSASYVALRRAYETIPTVPTPSPPPTATATPVPIDPAVPFVLAPPAVAQGDPFLIRVRAPGSSQVIAALGETTTPLFPTDGENFAGVLGAAIDLAPGEYSVHLTLIGPQGEPSAQSATLVVRDAGFEQETIQLDEETSRLLDPAFRQPELERLSAVWSVARPERLWSGRWRRPITGTTSSAFGTQRSYAGLETTGWHSGVDFRGRPGTPVLAPARGRVALAEALAARGNTVWLDHGWGVYSGYFHLTDIAVEPGALVEREALLGTVGATGTTTGPHLHWEIRVQGVAVQPDQWLIRDVGFVP